MGAKANGKHDCESVGTFDSAPLNVHEGYSQEDVCRVYACPRYRLVFYGLAPGLRGPASCSNLYVRSGESGWLLHDEN